MTAYREVLRERGFAALWVAQLVSRIGDGVHDIALLWIVYDVTGDPGLLAAVALANTTPNLLLSLPAGAVADRVDRKRLLVAAEAVRGVAVLAVPLVGDGEYLIPVVIAVALITSAAEAFFGPAQRALVPRLVPTEDLDAANSLVSLTDGASRTFYAVGGVVVGVGGSFAAFYLNAASFLLAAAALASIPAPAGRPPAASPVERTVFDDVRDGVAFVRGDAALVSIVCLGVLVDFAFVPLSVVVPVFAARVLGGDGATFGLLLGGFFAGTLAGNAAVGAVGATIDRRRGPVMIGATAATGVCVALGAALPHYVPGASATGVALAAFACAGFWNPFLNVPLTTYVQAVVPDDRRGTVFSVLRVGITGAAPLGIAAAGPATELFGPTAALVGMAAIVVAAGADALATPLADLGSVRPLPATGGGGDGGGSGSGDGGRRG